MPEYAETDVVEAADVCLKRRIAEGSLKLPANTGFKFIGNYQNQVRSENKLIVVLPLSLLIISLILYLEFSSVPVTFLVFTGIGIDVMIPMAVPTFGGMCVELLTLFVVPVGYCWIKELQLKYRSA
ncbi:MAG: hypothetical protein KKB51_15065 [Candidatus Riflebacteria bacterium]|nr:hypothetical protein [Candidatus Riflebacteria bacterium]